MRTKNEPCAVEGCKKMVVCRQYCTTHYERFRKYGNPLTMKQRPHHCGSKKAGSYWFTQMDGRRIADHVRIAERVLGRPLPPGAVVHHADENPENNALDNLVICPSKAYHALLHVRLRAMKACGNPNYRKCWMCKSYDDPQNMSEVPRRNGAYFQHRACANRRYAERKGA